MQDQERVELLRRGRNKEAALTDNTFLGQCCMCGEFGHKEADFPDKGREEKTDMVEESMEMKETESKAVAVVVVAVWAMEEKIKIETKEEALVAEETN